MAGFGLPHRAARTLRLVGSAIQRTPRNGSWWQHALERTPDDVLQARTGDGWNLGILHYRPSVEPGYDEPVILCHGFASSSFSLDLDEPHSLARFLAAWGFHAFVPDLRGRSASWPDRDRWADRYRYGFADHVDRDAPAILERVLRRTGARRAFWLGHSMGGMIGHVVAARRPRQIAGLVTLGSPARPHADRLLARFVELALALPVDPIPQRWPARMLASMTALHLPFPGWVARRANMEPLTLRRILVNAVEDISRQIMIEFANWVFGTHGLGTFDGVEYPGWIERLRAPLLCVAGQADRVAPPESVRPAFELARSGDRTWLCLGEGESTPVFGHLDMLLGRDARAIVYPRLATWIAERAHRQGRAALAG